MNVSRQIIRLSIVSAALTAWLTGCAQSPPAESVPASRPTPSWTAFAAPTPTQPLPDSIVERLDTVFDDDLAGGIPGAEAVVIADGQGVWTRSTGTSDGVDPLVPGSTFGLASLTKTFIAASVMHLVDEGVLSLDDPLADHLPADVVFDTNGTTLRDHLSMSSGIRDGPDPNDPADPSRRWTPQEVLALVPDSRSRPGGFAYSNLSYYLLGLVLAEAENGTTATALRSDVIAGPPFEKIVYQPDETPSPPLAMPLQGGKVRPIVAEHGGGFLLPLVESTAIGGSGAMAGTAEAVALWWRELVGGRIVSPESVALMTDTAGDGYGLGVFARPSLGGSGLSALANGGYGTGDMSYAIAFPEEGIVVVLLANRGGDPSRSLQPTAYRLAEIVAAG